MVLCCVVRGSRKNIPGSPRNTRIPRARDFSLGSIQRTTTNYNQRGESAGGKVLLRQQRPFGVKDFEFAEERCLRFDLRTITDDNDLHIGGV
jgi:hypothetical protein